MLSRLAIVWRKASSWYTIEMTLLLLIISCTILCSCGIPLDDFFPYGLEAGDSSVNKTLDGSSSVLILPFPFRFFDTLYSTLYVNNNGHISFDDPLDLYIPRPFPIPDLPLIAPYWADVDTTPPDGGQVWYRISTDKSLITDLIGSVMNSSQLTLSSFTPEYLVIVTWDHVGYYEERTDKTNTFQCILAADNAASYVIYQYADDEIQWTTSSSSGGTDGLGGNAALVGYNAGDCIRYKTVRESMTTEIINITKTSNIGIPGVYVFKVDGMERCTIGTQGTITTSPLSMTTITKMVTSATIATNTPTIATTTGTKTMATSTFTAVTSATNTPHSVTTTTSIKTMVNTLTSVSTPIIPRPDHCPKVETVSCSDNTAVVTCVIGGVVGLHDYSHPVSDDNISVCTT